MFLWHEQGRGQTLPDPDLQIRADSELSQEPFLLTVPFLETQIGYSLWSSSPALPQLSSCRAPSPRRTMTQWRQRWLWSRDSPLCRAAAPASCEHTGCSWQLPAAWVTLSATALGVNVPFADRGAQGMLSALRVRAGCPGPVPRSAGAARQSEPPQRLRLPGCEGQAGGKHSQRLL